MFWWDFLVGDTPELFAAVLLIIGVISLVSLVGHENTLAVILLPTLSVVALGGSVLRAWRGSKRG
jgi:cytochrome c biogenesis factor